MTDYTTQTERQKDRRTERPTDMKEMLFKLAVLRQKDRMTKDKRTEKQQKNNVVPSWIECLQTVRFIDRQTARQYVDRQTARQYVDRQTARYIDKRNLFICKRRQ